MIAMTTDPMVSASVAPEISLADWRPWRCAHLPRVMLGCMSYASFRLSNYFWDLPDFLSPKWHPFSLWCVENSPLKIKKLYWWSPHVYKIYPHYRTTDAARQHWSSLSIKIVALRPRTHNSGTSHQLLLPKYWEGRLYRHLLFSAFIIRNDTDKQEYMT